MAGGAIPAPTTTQTSHVSATATARLFPPGRLVPVAVVLAVAVGLLSLLPSLAAAVWEVPHLFVLGLVISYGVFTQRNTDVVVGQTDDGNGGAREGALAAWNARYLPDEPLVVVADHAASDMVREAGAMERPVSLPVRRLKKPPARESETDDGVGEETDSSSSASSAGSFCAGGAHTAPSPPSVLDADLGLSSPCSPPRPESSSPPFFAHGSSATESRGFSGYHHPRVPRDETLSEAEDSEVTDDWDDEEEVDDASDEMTTVSSESRSVRGDFITACANNDDEDDTSVDEELLKLASKAVPPAGADEVDRKADEFIAKFREQIRLQRL